MKMLHMVTFTLALVGAANWGLIGLFNLNLVNWLFSSMPMFEQLVYIAVGASAVYVFVTHANDCKICGAGKKK